MEEFNEAANATEAKAAPPMVSVTDLSSFMYCPRALYQKKVLGYEEKLNPAMVLGAIRHNFYDLANKYEERIVVHLPAEFSTEKINAAYSETYQNLLRAVVMNRSKSLEMFGLEPSSIISELRPIAVAEAAERAGNVHSFAAMRNIFGEELWQQLIPKIVTEMKVKSAMLRLKGVVDKVEIYGTTALPIELKTGKMPSDGVWPQHRVQVAAYMMLLQEKFNTTVGKAIIRYLDHNSSRTVVLNPYMELEIKELTEKVIRLLQGSAMPKQCGRENCSCTR
ncbi:Dna2/Cas4 domain-containing protein [Candidatus Woesearchaeota archaeon]|nr:Dna2/Cas4 domain-containing protein [Candidatus Woesearchaeota archaeon]